MSTVYLETSAALTWLLGEPDAERVRSTIDAADAVAISVLTLLEAERALIRAESAGRLREGDTQRLRGMLQRACASWMRMTVTEAVLSRASRPFPVEPVRTLDAVHLATALEFTTAFSDLHVLSFDRRVAANATALGIG